MLGLENVSFGTHDVDVSEARPIKKPPYRMSREKCKLAETEVSYMLEQTDAWEGHLDDIEKSKLI